MVTFQNIVIRWKLFYLYLFLLVILAILPINGPGSSINHIFLVTIRLDYVIHCIIYIPLVVFAWMDKEIIINRTPLKALAWLILLLLFGAATEWIQYYLPYRAFNINDMVANALGVLLGFILILSGLCKPCQTN